MSTLPEGFIIEHETRGVLVGQEYDESQIENDRTYLGWSTRWSWSARRSDGLRFESIEHARLGMSRIDERSRRLASVRRWGSWSVVA
jgi:hypothetical protein